MSEDYVVKEQKAQVDISKGPTSFYKDGRVGIIYGDVGTSEFKCSVEPGLRKGEYIKVNHKNCGEVLGRVDKLERKTDLSVDKAVRLSGGALIDIKEKMIATISVVGYRDDRGLLRVPDTPFKAGEPIFKADDALIRKVIGLKDNPKTGAYIGLLAGHEIKVYLDINSMVQKHVSVLAKTGGGKSYITGNLIEELMKHNVTVMIIDPHGEYPSMKEAGSVPKSSRDFGVSPKGYADKIIEFSPDTSINKTAKPLKFTLSNLEARDLLGLTNIKNVRQALTTMRKTIDFLRKHKPDYTIDDLINVLEGQEDPNNAALLNELEYLREVEIFAEKGTKITEMVVKGKTTVINLRGVAPDIQELLVNRIATALFELRKINETPPMMLVVEEAHNYCPQQGKVASSKIFRTIASEGRKFGLGLAIITQRAAKVDKNVLSQCNSQVILKVTNPNDLKAIVASVEGLTSGMTDDIQSLPIGVAIVTGGTFSMPMFVDVRPRESKHGGESVNVI